MSVSSPWPERSIVRESVSGPLRSLDDEVQYVKGVGPSGAQILAKLGIVTVGDLLRHIPRRYEDRTHFRRISDLVPGESATIQGAGRRIGIRTHQPEKLLPYEAVAR